MSDEKEGYLIEFHVIGSSVKVTAMDPKTLLEVSIIGDRKTHQRQLANVAVRKLKYMIQKQAGQ